MVWFSTTSHPLGSGCAVQLSAGYQFACSYGICILALSSALLGILQEILSSSIIRGRGLKRIGSYAADQTAILRFPGKQSPGASILFSFRIAYKGRLPSGTQD